MVGSTHIVCQNFKPLPVTWIKSSSAEGWRAAMFWKKIKGGMEGGGNKKAQK